MYFTGVEIPNAALIIDGRQKTSTLFFTITDGAARNDGISLDLVHNAKDVTGIEQVLPIDQFTPTLARLANRGASSTRRSSPRSSAANARPRSSASSRTR